MIKVSYERFRFSQWLYQGQNINNVKIEGCFWAFILENKIFKKEGKTKKAQNASR